MADSGKITVLGVGDVIPDWPKPEELFDPVIPTLKQADIRFAQLEANLSDKGEPQMAMLPVRKINPEKTAALKYAGFDVLSFASNHTLDRGETGFYDTMDALARYNIPVIGVGKNIDEARKPLIFDKKGTKIAFLAYCSVLPKGYDARENKPGAAPVRASTFYEQVDWQPGTPARIVTFADKADLAAMVDDIKKVRQQADVVIMSIHWGIHMVPAMIAMYQKEVGYAAVDAGVDVVFGHHAHILKGVDVYKGKVIFYSMCNLVMPSLERKKNGIRKIYNVQFDPEFPYYQFPVDSRKTMIVKATIANKKIERVSFLPLMINKMAQPIVQRRSDQGFNDVMAYMKQITESESLTAKYAADGDEVVIS